MNSEEMGQNLDAPDDLKELLTLLRPLFREGKWQDGDRVTVETMNSIQHTGPEVERLARKWLDHPKYGPP